MPKLSQSTLSGIFLRVSEGATLSATCREIGVNRADFYAALEADKALLDGYTRAREKQAEAWSDRMIEEIEDIGANPDPQRLKILIDARKWLMSKNHVGRYGDKIKTEVSGEGGGPLVVQWGKPKKSEE